MITHTQRMKLIGSVYTGLLAELSKARPDLPKHNLKTVARRTARMQVDDYIADQVKLEQQTTGRHKHECACGIVFWCGITPSEITSGPTACLACSSA